MQEKAKDIMSKKLITIDLDDSIRKSYQIMQSRKIRHLPVVDATGAIIGILSDRDVRRAMVPKSGVDSSAWDESNVEFDSKHKVCDFMSWPAKVISEDTRAIDAARLMLREKLSALVVSGGNERFPRGIVTTDDMLKLLVELLEEGPKGKLVSIGSLDFHKFGF